MTLAESAVFLLRFSVFQMTAANDRRLGIHHFPVFWLLFLLFFQNLRPLCPQYARRTALTNPENTVK